MRIYEFQNYPTAKMGHLFFSESAIDLRKLMQICDGGVSTRRAPGRRILPELRKAMNRVGSLIYTAMRREGAVK